MTLSKKRDKERKQLARLESKKVQPEYVVRPSMVMPKPEIVESVTTSTVQPKQVGKPRKRRDQMTAEELGIMGHDADGYPIYKEG